MSVFCTPDGRPFYAGTYFPPVERHGMPSFRRVVQALGDAWANERAQVLEQADALVGAVRRELRLAEALSEEAGGGRRRPVGGAPLLRLAGTPAEAPRHRRPRRAGGRRPRRGLRPRVGRLRAGAEVPPARPSSSSACAAPAAAAPTRPTPGTWPCARSTPWRPAASTTTWSAGSAATRPTPTGWCPTSRRCSPTRRSWPGPICTRGRTADVPTISAWSPRPWTSCCADLSTPEGALYSSFDADAGGVEGAHATFTLDELRQILPAPLVGPAAEWYGITPGGQLGGPLHPGPPRRGAAGAPARGGGGPRSCWRRPGRTRPAGPGREGADRVERHDGRHPGRGGRGHRPRRLRPPRRGDRRVPLGVHVRRRTADAELAGWAGAPSGRGGRLRLARRGLVPAVRVDGQGALAGAGGPGGPSAARPVLGRRVGRLLHHRQRRRGARRPSEGVPRRRGARRQLRRRRRAPARRRLRRRPEDRRGGRAHRGAGRTAAGAAPGRAGRPGGGAAHVERAQRDRRHGRTARPARRGAPATGSPPPSSRGASPTAARSSRSGPPSPAWPTSARGARARCPRRTPRPWPASWRH